MKRLLRFLFAISILLGTVCIPAAHSSVFQLPKTGQIISYAAGDDGERQEGLAWPSPRFVDNSDQTVTDKLTGLMWSKDANLMITRDPAISATGTVTWQGALDYVKKLNIENYLGHNDWRLPNIKELSSLIHRGQADQVAWLAGQGFSSVQNNNYWSSNGLDGIMSASAWYADVKNSLLNYSNKSSSSNYVWAVRSDPTVADPLTIAKSGPSFCYNSTGVIIDCSGTGQDGELQSGAAWPSPRFIDNRDRTLTDKLTGLVWSQSGNTPGPSICAPGAAKTWPEALDYVKCLNTNAWLGKTDWRLPNLNELQSLVYYGRLGSADWLKGQGFSNIGPNFWSSTTSAGNVNLAWSMTYTGSTEYPDKTTSANYLWVWPVRLGESGSYSSLSVVKSGSGTITSSLGGIDCGSTCSAIFPVGQVVNLTATAASGSSVSGWTGCDSSTGNQCTVIVTGANGVTATFDLIPTACGSAQGGSFDISPTASLCTSGTASAVTATTTSWNWTCSGSGTPSSCSAVRMANAVSSAAIQLPQTGQTVCYDESGPLTNTGAEIPCAGTGQDGDKQAGKPWPVPRYTDNNNGSVTDNLTGLIWLKNATCLWTTWQDAIDKSKALKGDGSQCDLTDGSVAGQWRLPNRKEMLSLLDRQRQDPALSIGHPFQGFNSYGYAGRFLWYWTSTYVRPYPNFAYMVNMYDGELDREMRTDSMSSLYAWPVRDSGQVSAVQLPKTGQKDCRPMIGADSFTTPCAGTGQDGEFQKGAAWPVSRLVNNGNGTVTDRLTGLIWLKNAFCTDTVNGISTDVDGFLPWSDALAWSNNIGNGSCGLTDNSAPGDWRLPNAVELESLIDASQATPAYPLQYPFTILNGGGLFWTSTTTAGNGSHVWVMMPSEGYLTGANGSWSYGKGGSSRRTWPVRGGYLGTAVISVLPASKNFGNVALWGSAEQVVTISNSGSASRLQVNEISIFGTDAGQFALNFGDGTGGTCGSRTPIVAPGGNCTITVSFVPTAAGAKTAYLRLSSSDFVTPNIDVSVSGTPMVNGACGASHKQTVIVAPAEYLCTYGAASSVIGTGPWSWDCLGENGGTDASCFANIKNYSVSFTPGANGTLTGTTSQMVNHGSAASAVTAVPNPNYHFVYWTGGLTSTSNPLTIPFVSSSVSVTANFAIDTFAVNFASTGNGAISGSASQTLAYGANAMTVTAVPAIGYHFVNWTEGSTEVSTSPTLNITNVTAAHNYMANFAINTYAVSFSPGANGTLTGITSQMVNYGGTASVVTANPAPNYHFVNWTGSLKSTVNPLTIAAVTSALNVTANFAIDTFAVKFTSAGNGSISGIANQTVNYGASSATVTAVPATGYHFVNWTEGGTEVSTNITLGVDNVAALHTYTANFGINSYALKYTAGANGSLTGTTTQAINYGGSATTVTAVPATNYHFVNWSEGAMIVGANALLTVYNVAADHSYTANFAIDSYSVTFKSLGNGTLTGTTSQTVNVGANATTVTAVPATGYHFVNWTESGTVVGTSTALDVANITAAHVYTANFAVNTYTVTFAAAGNGSFAGIVSQTVNHGVNTSTVTAVPATNYHFVNWSEGATIVGTNAALTVNNVTADHIYTANFVINPFKVSFASSGNGTISGAASQTVNFGSDATTVTAVPAAGYHFVNWTEGVLVVGNSARLNVTNVTAAHSYTANFSINTYEVTFVTGGNGTLSGNATSQTVNYGANAATVNAVPATNYHFVNWTEGANVVGMNSSLTASYVTAVHSYTANFAVNTYSIKFTSAGNGTISGNASQTIGYGADAVTVTAVPSAGYRFVDWKEGTTVVGTSAALTVSNITSARNFTANFALDPINSVCGTSNGGIFTITPASNLCAIGVATPPTGTGPWSWKCTSVNGGTNSDCSANIKNYNVVPLAGANNNSITPSTPQIVNHGSTTKFTVSSEAGYGIVATGCGGTLIGSTYSTGMITGDCTVSVVTVSRNAIGGGSVLPSIADAMKALNSYSGKLRLSAEEKIRYDVAPLGSNGFPVGDGVVDIADIILILRKTVGLGTW